MPFDFIIPVLSTDAEVLFYGRLHACSQGRSPGRFANPEDDANLDQVGQPIVAKAGRLGVALGAAPPPAVNS